jgi:Bacterial transcriptional activator domain
MEIHVQDGVDQEAAFGDRGTVGRGVLGPLLLEGRGELAAGVEKVTAAFLEEAALACGRHPDLTGELELLCQAHPLRERLRSARITALYRCGRQADALGAYQQLRTTLADELGIDPSAQLRWLEAAVLAQDPGLDLTPPPDSSPARSGSADVSHPAVGCRFIAAAPEQLWRTHLTGLGTGGRKRSPLRDRGRLLGCSIDARMNASRVVAALRTVIAGSGRTCGCAPGPASAGRLGGPGRGLRPPGGDGLLRRAAADEKPTPAASGRTSV